LYHAVVHGADKTLRTVIGKAIKGKLLLQVRNL